MKIVAKSAAGKIVSATNAVVPAFDPSWMGHVLSDLGFHPDTKTFDPRVLKTAANNYLLGRVSIEADDPLGRNAMALHSVASAATSCPGASVYLVS